ncbi:MAG: hypothetical protein GY820_46540 [Gammaproteobacteria bacterium]|nr:hypothetical protein [Gammaproteobacteria bacterium]
MLGNRWVGKRVRAFDGADPRLDAPPFTSAGARTIVTRHAARLELGMDRAIADARAAGVPLLLCVAADRAGARSEGYYRALAAIPNANRTKRLQGTLPLLVGAGYILRKSLKVALKI